MRIIISPAKKMRVDTDTLPWKDLPCMIDKAEVLYSKLRSMSYGELKKLWGCSDAIAEQNLERLKTSDLRTRLTPAILSYEGIQYRYMAPGVFTRKELDYVQTHLRILSGLYGVLRPFDGVTPYRLEMQAKLKIGNVKDLYSYWGGTLAENLWRESDCVVNLASREYGDCVSHYPRSGKQLIGCVFGEEMDGRIVEKGTLCKMARGEMVRWMAVHQITRVSDLTGLQALGYRFSPAHSNQTHLVFLTGEF